MGYSAGPEYNRYYKYCAHKAMEAAESVIEETEERFAQVFGRKYPGMVEAYRCEDADYVLVTLGSIAGLARSVVDARRAEGQKVGLLRIRYMRPFPYARVAAALEGAKAFGVLEKDISFGAEGTVFTNVNSALQRAGAVLPSVNFVGGLGGDDISEADIDGTFDALAQRAAGKGTCDQVVFVGVDAPWMEGKEA